jgi:uncharacterized phage protein gp47/JayE
MASQNFKTPSQIADDYLSQLKALKPGANTAQQDSDWWIKSRVVGGALAGAFADQRAISNDAFPQSARHDALAEHLQTYFDEGFISPQSSVGNAAVTGTVGTPINIGLQFSYQPNGNTYQAVSATVIPAAGSVLVPIQSVGTGQNQNLLSGAPLSIVSPPAGLNSAAIASGNIADGRDGETDPEAVARILAFIRNPISGGTVTDYEQWALAADPSVVAASVFRYAYGLGSLAVIITAGTTNIDTALNTGIPVIQIPTQSLIDTVQAYIDTLRPVTDCVQVAGPTPVTVNVTAYVKYNSGNGSTVLNNQTITQDQLVQREVQRAIYKTPPGGRVIDSSGSGFVLVSEIEQTIDIGLSAEPYETGIYAPILLDREVAYLNGASANIPLAPTQIAVPGVITVVSTGWS